MNNLAQNYKKTLCLPILTTNFMEPTNSIIANGGTGTIRVIRKIRSQKPQP